MLSAQGSVARAETLTESEPNDAPDRAQSVSGIAVVRARLGPEPVPGETPPPEPAPKPGRKARAARAAALLDEDWYRMPSTPPGNLTQIELRDAPACAELELYDDTGRTVVRRAKGAAHSRPVLPSLGPGAHASLIRVSCKGKEGGTYTLAVFTRAGVPNEEVEPNDSTDGPVQIVRTGQPWQGTMAPSLDIDTYVLDTAGIPPGDAFVLSATGAPDVEWELRLLDPVTRTATLTRRALRGQGLLVPNLDASRLEPGTLIQLKATAGQSVDTPYALALQPYLPPGCAAQADCRDRVPGEREPNDLPDRAVPVTFSAIGPTQIAGLIDGAGDVDWLLVVAAPGQAVTARLEAPASLSVTLQYSADPAVAPIAVPAGKSGVLPGVPTGTGRLLLGIAADKPGTWSRNEAYRLTIRLIDGQAWEAEAGDETAGAAAWAPSAALLAAGAGTDGMAHGGWQRRGALFPAGDRDAFGMDLRSESSPMGLELVCEGDGAPGLSCALQDMQGHDLLTLSPPGDGVARAPLALAPGAWRVVVSSAAGRSSLRPYTVSLRRSPEAAGLPVVGGPAEPPAASTPVAP